MSVVTEIRLAPIRPRFSPRYARLETDIALISDNACALTAARVEFDAALIRKRDPFSDVIWEFGRYWE